MSEDDLLVYYLQRYVNNRKQFFPKVQAISTLPTSPDIDLLFINQEKRLVIGYEFKVLKYYKNWTRKGVSYRPIYEGIGEALAYFQHGIDKCYLVLGLVDLPSEWVTKMLEKIKQITSIFNMFTDLFTGWSKEIHNLEKISPKMQDYFDIKLNRPRIGDSEDRQWGFGCFGIIVLTKDYCSEVKKAEEYFPVSENEDLSQLKECLLRKQFRYKKNFLKTVDS